MAKFVRYKEVSLTCIKVLFRIFYFYWCRENRSLHRGLRYIAICYIEDPLSSVLLGQCVGAGGGCQPLCALLLCATISKATTITTNSPRQSVVFDHLQVALTQRLGEHQEFV